MTNQAPKPTEFATELDYYKALYEFREQECHELSEEILRLKRVLNHVYGHTDKPKPPTAQERAIQLFLSKEAPRSDPCGCMGRQPLNKSSKYSPGRSYPNEVWQEIVVHNLGKDKLKTVQQLRRDFDLPLQHAPSILKAGTFRKECTYVNQGTVHRLKQLGCTVEVLEHGAELEPDCPCGMQWVVEVDNHYYRIHENRTPDGITHTAEDLGHMAGPFKIKKS